MTQKYLEPHEFERVQKIILAAYEDMGPLNDFERNFIENNVKRLEKYGDRTLFSDKQLSVLNRIEEAYDS